MLSSAQTKILNGAKFAAYLLALGDYHRYVRWKSRAVRIAAGLGAYEAENLRFMRSILPPGGCAIDIGANCGVYLKAMLETVGPTGLVWAFEPSPDTFPSLQREFRNRENVRLLNEALSDLDSNTSKLAVPLLFGRIPEPSLGSLEQGTSSERTESVTVRALDSYLSELYRVDFIKIDVEGSEIRVLQGAREAIRKFQPIVQFEMINPEIQIRMVSEYAEQNANCIYCLRENLCEVSPQLLRSPGNFLMIPCHRRSEFGLIN